MKRIFYILCCIALFSCSKNDYVDTTIEKTMIEFPQSTQNETISFIAGEEYQIAVPLQVFGGTSTATIFVDAESSLSKDAYSVASTKELKNSVLDSIYITINTTKLKKGTSYTITLTISSSDITVSENYKSCIVTFSQQAFMDFFTGTYSCYESSTNSTYDVEFTKLNDSTIKNNNFWDFPLSGQYVPFVFVQDESQALQIPEDTQWTDLLGNKYLVSGSGSYDLDGNFFVNFTMKDATTNAVYQTGKQVYTKK